MADDRFISAIVSLKRTESGLVFIPGMVSFDIGTLRNTVSGRSFAYVAPEPTWMLPFVVVDREQALAMPPSVHALPIILGTIQIELPSHELVEQPLLLDGHHRCVRALHYGCMQAAYELTLTETTAAMTYEQVPPSRLAGELAELI